MFPNPNIAHKQILIHYSDFHIKELKNHLNIFFIVFQNITMQWQVPIIHRMYKLNFNKQKIRLNTRRCQISKKNLCALIKKMNFATDSKFE